MLNTKIKVNDEIIKIEKIKLFNKIDFSVTVKVKDTLTIMPIEKAPSFSICGIKIKRIN